MQKQGQKQVSKRESRHVLQRLDIGKIQPGESFARQCGGVLKGYGSQQGPGACLLCTGRAVESNTFIFSFVQQLSKVGGFSQEANFGRFL